MERDYKDDALLFKALADETRLKIVCMLKGRKLCACRILEDFNITQPTLSYHMKILTECGLVDGARHGAWMHYSINRERFEELKGLVDGILSDVQQKRGAGCGGKCKG